jgi:hypothetical protein
MLEMRNNEYLFADLGVASGRGLNNTTTQLGTTQPPAEASLTYDERLVC